jgi:hypothetical protein
MASPASLHVNISTTISSVVCDSVLCPCPRAAISILIVCCTCERASRYQTVDGRRAT